MFVVKHQKKILFSLFLLSGFIFLFMFLYFIFKNNIIISIDYLSNIFIDNPGIYETISYENGIFLGIVVFLLLLAISNKIRKTKELKKVFGKNEEIFFGGILFLIIYGMFVGINISYLILVIGTELLLFFSFIEIVRRFFYIVFDLINNSDFYLYKHFNIIV